MNNLMEGLSRDDSEIIVAPKDIVTTKEDGREIVVAREGQEVSRKTLKRFGIELAGKKRHNLGEEKGKKDDGEKSKDPAENKSKTPAENKGAASSKGDADKDKK